MKKHEVVIGDTYIAKVSGVFVGVRILRASDYGGWYARNLTTGREIRIRSASRLRENVTAYANDAQRSGAHFLAPFVTPRARRSE